MTNIAVVGVGQTKFGEHWNMSLRDLIVDAGILAIKDSGIDKEMIDAIYVGNMSGVFTGQEHLAAMTADQLGLSSKPSVRCEAACASGGLAFRQAYLAVKSGLHDVVLVIGAEKMTDLKTEKVINALMMAGSHEWESSIGLTFPGLYALMARRHMEDFGTTREQLAMVSVNNHKNARKNPLAQFQNEISIDDVLNSSLIAEPLRVLDCSPITDGSAAVIIASDVVAKKFEKPVCVLASSHTTDTLALHDRKSLTEMAATKLAAKQTYEQSGLKPNDIDIAEVHDCFSINEIIAIEDLGFCKKGDGGRFVEKGGIAVDGEKPTNTTGGLKAIGHPVGATGVRQVIDIVKQLRGDSFNQVNCNYGLTLNIGGSGATCVLNIFGKEL